MRDLTAVNAIIGLLLPLLIAIINQYHWSPKVKGAVALLVCLCTAAVTELLRGSLHWANWRDTAIVILGAALISYQTLWKPSTIAPALEAATTLGSDVRRREPI